MQPKWILPILLLFLSCISILVLRSIAPQLVARQFVFFIIGFGLFFGVATQKYFILEKWAWLWYIALCLVLAVTFVIGGVTRGSTRWIAFGSFHIQGSQLAIPVTAILGSKVILEVKNFFSKDIVRFFAILGLPALLILIEPDLGTTLIYLLSVGMVLFFSHIKLRYIMGLVVLGAILVAFSWEIILQPYQKERLLSFHSTELSDAGYNAYQSLIAVGSGRIFGKGLGQGIQSHLRFLPEKQTDFVFASLAEELGFVGGATVILLYTILIASLLLSAQQAPPTAKLYCYAISTMLLIQTAVNIGMNIGLLPITGVTLPFISYGGSSVISLFISLGVIQGINCQKAHHPVLSITPHRV